MARDVTQTCCIPITKMELLSGELRLLKGAIEQLHGRCELLLSEIAELQREQESGKETFASPITSYSPDQPEAADIAAVPPYPEDPDNAVVVPTPPLVDQSSEQMRPSAPAANAVCANMLIQIDDNETAPSLPSPQSCAIIVLNEQRRPATRRLWLSARGLGRAAAMAVLIPVVLAIVAANTGFAYGLAELFAVGSR